jgi:uncharacterized protein (TIGR02118 family)
MPVSLLALYRRPSGGDAELDTFRHRYSSEHLPLVRQTPGLRSMQVHRVSHAFQESDLVMVAEMVFDTRAELDAGIQSEPMRQAARTLREIAPGGFTLLVLEPEPEALYAHDSLLGDLYEEAHVSAEATAGSREPTPDSRAAERDATGDARGTPDTSIPRDAGRE